VAQFASGIVQVNGSVGTICSMVWNPGSTSTTTFGSLGSVPATASFTGLIVANTGTNAIYLSSGSVAASAATGVQVAAGSEMLLTGYSGTVGTAGTIWAQTLTAGTTSSAQSGLPSVVAVV
jgi:hypothetical protein